MFDEEVAGHKAELQLLSSTVEEQKSMTRQISVNMNKVTVTANDRPVSTTHTHPMVGSTHEVATRKVSAKSKAVMAERRISQFHQGAAHHTQDHLFAKLADKEHLLKAAKQDLAKTREVMQSMENELEKLRRENAELVKLQGMHYSNKQN